MGIHSVGSARDLLNSYKAEEWVSSDDLETERVIRDGFTIEDAPDLEYSKNTKSFGEMLAGAIGGVNQDQINANQAHQRAATGDGDLAEAMIQADKAEISYKALNNVRKKLLDAYKDIMRMQL